MMTIELDKLVCDPSLTERLPPAFAFNKQILPCAEIDGIVHFATNQIDEDTKRELERLFGKNIKINICQEEKKLREKIQLFYSSLQSPGRKIQTNDAVTLTNDILLAAIFREASDIHFDPNEENMQVRLRIHGSLGVLRVLNKNMVASVVSRIKVMAGMDISEKRSPQDGKFRYRLPNGSRTVDIRAATVPTIHGEKITLRLLGLDKEKSILKNIGLSPQHYQILCDHLSLPHGLILVNGTTGSGKSTTLYAALKHVVQSNDLNVITVEDPVESQLEGTTQIQVDDAGKITFASALRSILRHDPDIVMIGEIRDRETADMSTRAAMTGHLVLSSLHCGSAIAAVTRLSDIGVEPYLISSGLTLSIHQQLARKVCPQCKEEFKITKEQAISIGKPWLERKPYFRGKGCLYCAGKGIKGRIPVFQVLPIDEKLSEAIRIGEFSNSQQHGHYSKSFIGEIDDVEWKLKKGLISIEEAMTLSIPSANP